MKPFLWILLTLLVLTYTQGGFGVSTAAAAAASALSAYNMDITIGGSSSSSLSVQAGASSTIVFPAEYSGRLTSGSYPCSVTSWNTLKPEASPSPICTASGSIITITNLFSKAYTFNYSF